MRSKLFSTICGLLLIGLVGATACNRRSPNAGAAGGAAGAARSHGHSHAHGLHGGHIVELDTNAFHAELTQDEAVHKIGIHLLDPNAATVLALPVDAVSMMIVVKEGDKPTEYKLTAAPQTDDGKSSYFEIESEPLVAALTGGNRATAPPELKITIEDQSFTGVIEDVHTHGHAIAHSQSPSTDEILVWQQQFSEAGYDISLGHHNVVLMAGSKAEPAAQLTQNGEPVADAKVFNSLLADDGTVLSEEVAAIYEPPTEAEPGHFGQGGLMIPPSTRSATIRFRIVFPEGKSERTFDVPVKVQ